MTEISKIVEVSINYRDLPFDSQKTCYGGALDEVSKIENGELWLRTISIVNGAYQGPEPKWERIGRIDHHKVVGAANWYGESLMPEAPACTPKQPD